MQCEPGKVLPPYPTETGQGPRVGDRFITYHSYTAPSPLELDEHGNMQASKPVRVDWGSLQPRSQEMAHFAQFIVQLMKKNLLIYTAAQRYDDSVIEKTVRSVVERIRTEVGQFKKESRRVWKEERTIKTPFKAQGTEEDSRRTSACGGVWDPR